MKKILRLVVVVMLAVGVLAACSDDNSGRSSEGQTAKKQLDGFVRNQPTPVFTWSQLRQNLIEIETAQAQTTQTTTFFFNQGVAKPITDCPSIGFPIPTTNQLTNPDKTVGKGHDGIATVAQIEANGVYTGDSTGTYVICVSAEGKPYAVYWEGFVQTITGPAKWSGDHVELIGPPSFHFSKGKK